jgi:hypothetical protein
MSLPCYGCAYRQEVPGSAHSRCVFNWKLDKEGLAGLLNSAHITERTARWFMFPLNYDPTWGPDACPAKSDTLDKDKVAPPPDPLLELLSFLGR